MKGRRPLIAGIHADSDVKDIERAFVYANRNETSQSPLEQSEPEELHVSQSTETIAASLPATAQFPQEPEKPTAKATVPEDRVQPQVTGRVPITTRTRPEVASALKKASLQRQMAGVDPCYVQDIMEEALITWLSAKGYL